MRKVQLLPRMIKPIISSSTFIMAIMTACVKNLCVKELSGVMNLLRTMEIPPTPPRVKLLGT